ncbi:SusC/RagA family TonB-linked outer membrane protein [Capnocytophaga felis]|uniref:SusC/RagA family TonB-linked outer membrane protein n=1 Tax=Capnocytophaga felis TaxID=2267611 RepID=A0A5M4BAC3_9FLAO|nr:TonB-dependent receptor [Capnocytophaga felis]GET46167.1 SusC/RagA family TonB-linked outer membrane protein [Capnocytophaga felis]GET48958.1 SusC/RagA family TonB-linked outer membrane protein [Capnocytophaga felis]
MKEKLIWTVSLFFLALQIALAQEKTITGVVKDEHGEPLPGITVTIKGSTRGVATDFDGHYKIKANVGDVLQFLGVGLKTVSKSVSASTSKVDVVMHLEVEELEGVVIVGYGSVSKKDLTSAVSIVDAGTLVEKPVTSVAQALQGKTAGVQVVSTGGRAGDNTQISIRGNGSLTASNNVLYIIDGVPQETMVNVAAEDIKSMQVLKDAASAAIYGSRASNGVVIIETKTGKNNSKPSVTFTSSVGIQEIIKYPKLLKAQQYKQVLDASRINYQNDIATGILNAPKNPNELTPLQLGNYETDWMSLVLQKGLIRNNQISVSGGGESTSLYFSASNIKQEGIIKQDQYQMSRFRLNAEQKVGKKFSFGVQSYFTMSESSPIADDNNTYQPWSKALNARPDLSPYTEDGKLNRNLGVNNPLHAFERYVISEWQRVGGTFYMNYDILEGLRWRSAYTGNLNVNRYNRYDAPNTKRGENGDGVPTGYGYYSTQNNRDFQSENTLTYDKSFFDKKLKLNFLAGHSFQKWIYEDSYVEGEKFASSDLRWLVSAAEINKGRSYYIAMGLESYFSRLQLNWRNKYHLMVSARYDGSSKFLPENRWGVFPAASLGWTVSEEEFFKVSFINDLKLRASIGYTGNQTGISYASGQDLIGSGYNYDQNPGLASAELFNPALKWETGQTINLGLDLGLFKNRITLSADVYDKKTKDLLTRVAVPHESGFSTQLRNIGSIRNKGFEVTLNAQIIKSEDFTWDFNSNFSYNKNTVEKIGNEKGYYTTGFVSVVKEGAPLGSFYLPEAIGIAQEKYEYKNQKGEVTKVVYPGDMLYKDINGDGKIDAEDNVLFEGGIAPIYGGLGTKFAYKMFDLSVTAQYSIGKRIYAMYKENALAGGDVGYPAYSENMILDQMDYWTPQNTNAVNPRPHMAASVASWNNLRSSRFLENADYLRISDITLGFNVKGEDIKNIVKSLRIYAQVRNPFTFTKYSGVDPETHYVDQSQYSSQNRSDTSKISAGVDYNGIPNVKVYSLGLNINF